MKSLKLLIFLLSTFSILANGSIFVLHRFDDSRYPSTNMETASLRKYFDYLNANNYKVVPLKNMVEKIKKNEGIPDNWVAFTIDDAYKSFIENGLQVFKEYNFPFTVFVNTEAVDREFPDFMTWDDLREVEKYGSIGNHSHTHIKLVNSSREEILTDTKKAIELLEANLENPLRYYAYPYGEYDEKSAEILKEAGINVIFNQSTGAVSNKSNIYSINRSALGNNENIKSKLNIKYLDAKWNDVTIVDNKVIKIKVSMPLEVGKVEVYLSGYGWEYANVVNGQLEYNINKELKLNRSRIIIKDFNNRWTSYLIIK